MTRPAFGVLLLGAFALPLAAQDTKPEDAIKKAIAAHGGAAALKKYPAGKSEIAGKIISGKAELPFTGSLAFSIPGKVRTNMTVEANGLKTVLVQVVNGDKVLQTENGAKSTLSKAVKGELRESAVIHEMSLLYPLLDAAKYTLTADPDATIDGRECAVVVVRAKGAKEARLAFDRKTGYLAALRRTGLSPGGKPADELTVFSDYKPIEGMVVPMRSRVSHDGRPYLDITITDYKPLEKVDEKLFVTE
jgi:hypothetical protein